MKPEEGVVRWAVRLVPLPKVVQKCGVSGKEVQRNWNSSTESERPTSLYIFFYRETMRFALPLKMNVMMEE